MAELTNRQLAEKVVQILDAKKAEEIKAIRIDKLTSLGDYFVIASAGSNTQAKALSDEVEEKLSKELGLEPLRIEGYQTASWILLDYNEVIVHIFYKEARDFYSLDRLWNDGEELDLSKILKPN